MPTKYLYRGDGFDASQASAWAAVAHFDSNNVFKASFDGSTHKTLPLCDVELVSGTTKTVTAGDNGKTFVVTNTAGCVLTLPKANLGKLTYTFSVNADLATGPMDLACQSTDTIVGYRLAGSTGKGVRLAEGGDAAGDFVQLVSDGTTTWYIASEKGILIQIP